MSTVSADDLLTWHRAVNDTRDKVALKRQTLRAHPASGQDDPMRTGLDAVFDSLSTTLTMLQHLWVLADISQ